jgi:hypothetical protein
LPPRRRRYDSANQDDAVEARAAKSSSKHEDEEDEPEGEEGDGIVDLVPI